jgi:diaminohydroxyphosphoribosylaminopyrimidine deaminase/5-amino-6-(5-phosphoribosylamino)uracil reductase
MSAMPRPHVTLKLATSLDGRIATASGESRWITGEAARAEVHKMRATADAVMIGAGTVRADNPSLLARTEPPPARQPKRVVLTTRLDLLAQGRLFEDIDASPLIIFGAECAGSAHHANLEAAGARIEQAPRAAEGIDIKAVIARLAELGVASILAEGGGKLAAALISAGVVDRLEWFRAPILIGGDGRAALGVLGLAGLAAAPAWRRLALRELGPDLWESYERA